MAIFQFNFPFQVVFDEVKGQDDPVDYKKLREILREIWERLGEI